MDIIEAIVLGILQGITEFLPISSSGHLEIINNFFSQQLEDSLVFSITVHLAAALGAIVVFREYIKEMLDSAFALKWDEASMFLVKSRLPSEMTAASLRFLPGTNLTALDSGI